MGPRLVNDNGAKLVLALLEEAHQQGHRAVAKTSLIKFLYLSDFYYHQEAGRTWTVWEWRFLHFGPFAPAAAQMLDELVLRRHIISEERQSEAEDRKVVLYSLPEHREALFLRDIGIPAGVAISLRSDFKRYAGKLPELLDYVYFRTTPMESAKPGDVLDFSRCTKPAKADFRPIEMKRLSPKVIRRTRERVRELIRQHPRATLPNAGGPIDDVYLGAMAELEDEPISTDISGCADIKVD